MGFPRCAPLSPIHELEPALINPLKRLAWGSILAGLLITSNIILPKTPTMTIPPLLKMAALALTLLGLTIAFDLARLTNKQFKVTPVLPPYYFSSNLGFFPSAFHRLSPKLHLVLGQLIATQMLDQTWLEKSGPKAVSALNLPLITTTSNAQRGLIKTHLALFFTTLLLGLLLAVF